MAVKLLEVPAEIIETALDLELQDGEVIADSVDGERCIFLAGLHRAERAIAARVRRLSTGALPWPAIDAAKTIPWFEVKAGVTLAASQREAVQLALARWPRQLSTLSHSRFFQASYNPAKANG